MGIKTELKKVEKLVSIASSAHTKLESKCDDVYAELEKYIDYDIWVDGSVCYQAGDGIIFLQPDKARVCRIEGIIEYFYHHGQVKLDSSDLHNVAI